ncbi:hypothetical protein [Sphingomonas crusticola]|uniref:hypothetical protein n=1 Tax=Sphingomonas crusticola TaxID=1697973 RepID=UPI0013C322D7|nr:hypothetical protein [Sphingomonas crusticola]
MANNVTQKRGLTTFGWLALGGVAAALLSSKDRRDKVLNSAKDLAGKFGGAGSEQSGATTSA